MHFSRAHLQTILAGLPPARAYRVAFSGGCDSTVLLHALAALREQLAVPLTALHVDHQLHPHSGAWSAHCEQVCAQLGIPCSVLRVDARAQAGESREAAARSARYGALAQALAPGEALVTAHHRADQAETFLLQLLRGAGPRGLAAMPTSAPFASGILLRPLLDFSRAELCDYARAQGLSWIDDPSNFDIGFDRNLLRHRFLPLLAERWPAAEAVIGRAARHQAEAAELLDELAALDLAAAGGGRPGLLRTAVLRELSPARQRNLLRYALRRSGLPLPSSAVLERVLTEVLAAREDAEPCVAWPGVEVRRYRDELFLSSPLGEAPSPERVPWDPARPLRLPGGLGRLRAEPTLGQGVRLPAGPVEVGFRTGGERCRPAGRQHQHAVKKLLQEAGVPPWERDRMPLLFVSGELAAVADRWICEPFAAKAGEAGFLLHWERIAIETEGENKDNLPGLAP